MEDKNYGDDGLFMSLLTVLFVGLKLGGIINWSWWWVLSPLWISIALVLITFAVGCIIFFVSK